MPIESAPIAKGPIESAPPESQDFGEAAPASTKGPVSVARQNSASEPAEPLSDTIIALASQGDRAAQEKVLATIYDLVRGTLYRLLLGRAQDLDDLQQSVLMKVLTGLKTYRGDAQFTTWVTGICVNVVRESIRRNRRRQAHETQTENLAEAGNNPFTVTPQRICEHREVLNSCTKILEAMSVNHRTVFILRNVYGHSIREISDIMGSATSTTRLRLYYARKAFKRGLTGTPGLNFALTPQDAEGDW